MNSFSYSQLFKEFELNFRTLPAVRIVSSFQEARFVETDETFTENKKYNRFPLVFFTNGQKSTTFNFSLYLDTTHNKIYAFFNEIENATMLCADKDFPFMSATFDVSNYYNDVDNFLDNDFTDKITSYYSGTKFDFANIKDIERHGLFSLSVTGDAAGFDYFRNQCKHSKMRCVFYPYNNCIIPPKGAETTDYADYVSNIVDMDIYAENTGNYVFVTDKIYLWMIEKSNYDYYFKKIKDRAEESKTIAFSTDLTFLEV